MLGVTLPSLWLTYSFTCLHLPASQQTTHVVSPALVPLDSPLARPACLITAPVLCVSPDGWLDPWGLAENSAQHITGI